MKRPLQFIAATLLTILATQAVACNVYFNIKGESDKYNYQHVADFIKLKIRANVSPTQDEFDRYHVVVGRDCAPGDEEQSTSATITLQRNNVYIKELNGSPLCAEKMTPDGYRCEKGKYNFVDYKGGADISINEDSISKSLNEISKIASTADLEAANNNQDTKLKVHNAIRLLAMLLAESARFDYVLDDIECIEGNNKTINFMDYWTLVHNWGTITSRVKRFSPEMLSPETKQGAGSLFVPVTREMVGFFNANLTANPPAPDSITPDGKNKPVPIREKSCNTPPSPSDQSYGAQVERDEILSLAAMVMVEKDWQTNSNGRGHNIGSILVDKTNKPVFWARNAIRERNNSTQHGEVRLIENYLNCPSVDKYVDGYTVYTTLEPCAMCSGMIAMTKIKRVVYLQEDPAYGHVGETLRKINYPRKYDEFTPRQLAQKIEIENRYHEARVGGHDSITDFLLSDAAHKIFVSAKLAIDAYQLKHQENASLLISVRAFLDKVSREKYGEEMMQNCPTVSLQ